MKWGHVTARHSAERQGAGMVAQIGAVLLGAVTGSSQVANLAAFGAQAYLQSYSRDQELEADMLGVRYMSRAGYDPDAMTTFLATLGEQAKLDARMMGRDPSSVDQYNIMATHPRSVDRVRPSHATGRGRSSRRSHRRPRALLDHHQRHVGSGTTRSKG